MWWVVIFTPFRLSSSQIWRLITSFLFFGSLGFSFVFNIIFLYLLTAFPLAKDRMVISVCLWKQYHKLEPQQYHYHRRESATESLTQSSYRYCRMLEEGCFRGRTADFVFMFLFGGIVMTVSFYTTSKRTECRNECKSFLKGPVHTNDKTVKSWDSLLSPTPSVGVMSFVKLFPCQSPRFYWCGDRNLRNGDIEGVLQIEGSSVSFQKYC